MKDRLRQLARRFGYDLRRCRPDGLPMDLGEETADLVSRVKPFTMTTPERIAVLERAVDYVAHAGIPGSLVECGVWKGGSSMVIAIVALRAEMERDLYLFDAYDTPIPPPGSSDKNSPDDSLVVLGGATDELPYWAYVTVEEVAGNVAKTGYPDDKVHLVRGLIEQTIPAEAPDSIALLRLDTDTYESTRHEMEHLFPRLAIGGVLLVDDYGSHPGSKRAVDEYFGRTGEALLLNRIDQSGVIGIRTGIRKAS